MKLYDVKAMAKILDLSERRVRQLRDENIIKEYPNAEGLYDLMPTLHSYINYLRKSNPDSDVDYVTERAKLMRAKRINEEFDLKIKEGKLHDSEIVETILSAMMINFKSRLMAIPSKLSPVLSKKTDKAEIYKILKSSIDEALYEISSFDDLFGEGIEEIEDEEIHG